MEYLIVLGIILMVVVFLKINWLQGKKTAYQYDYLIIPENASHKLLVEEVRKKEKEGWKLEKQLGGGYLPLKGGRYWVYQISRKKYEKKSKFLGL